SAARISPRSWCERRDLRASAPSNASVLACGASAGRRARPASSSRWKQQILFRVTSNVVVNMRTPPPWLLRLSPAAPASRPSHLYTGKRGGIFFARARRDLVIVDFPGKSGFCEARGGDTYAGRGTQTSASEHRPTQTSARGRKPTQA